MVKLETIRVGFFYESNNEPYTGDCDGWQVGSDTIPWLEATKEQYLEEYWGPPADDEFEQEWKKFVELRDGFKFQEIYENGTAEYGQVWLGDTGKPVSLGQGEEGQPLYVVLSPFIAREGTDSTPPGHGVVYPAIIDKDWGNASAIARPAARIKPEHFCETIRKVLASGVENLFGVPPIEVPSGWADFGSPNYAIVIDGKEEGEHPYDGLITKAALKDAGFVYDAATGYWVKN